MFNFTTETIINSASQYAGVAANADPGLPAGKTALWIKKLNKFPVANPAWGIIGTTTEDGLGVTTYSSILYKRAYTAASQSVLTVTIPTTVIGTIYRLGITITANGYPTGMFARDRVLYGKPFYVEVTATSVTASVTATALKNAWNATFASYENFPIATTATANLVLTTQVPYQDFQASSLQSITFTTAGVENYPVNETLTVVSNTSGEPAFGDYTWLLRNSRLPTIDNYRPFGLNQEELPTVGSNYTQYTFQFQGDRGQRGQSVVGEPTNSITTHVLWVRTDLVTAFESALTTAGITLTTI